MVVLRNNSIVKLKRHSPCNSPKLHPCRVVTLQRVHPVRAFVPIVQRHLTDSQLVFRGPIIGEPHW
jgi:hypothetical protein